MFPTKPHVFFQASKLVQNKLYFIEVLKLRIKGKLRHIWSMYKELYMRLCENRL